MLVFVLYARELVSQSDDLPSGSRGQGFLYAFRTSHGSGDVGVRLNMFVCFKSRYKHSAGSDMSPSPVRETKRTSWTTRMVRCCVYKCQLIEVQVLPIQMHGPHPPS